MKTNRINVKYLAPNLPAYCEIYKDLKTGIVTIHNGRTGNGHSCHANIDGTGSIRGMKNLGYWRKNDRCLKSFGVIYNVDTLVVSDDLDKITEKHCKCIACRERRREKSEASQIKRFGKVIY